MTDKFENQKEPLFTAQFADSIENMEIVIKRWTAKRISALILDIFFVCCFLVLCVINIVYLIHGYFNHGLIISAVGLIWFSYQLCYAFFGPKKIAKKKHQEMLELFHKETKNELFFYEDYLLIHHTGNDGKMNFSYTDFTKIVKTKNLYSFYLGKKYCSFPITAFSKNVLHDFDTFIANKCPHAKKISNKKRTELELCAFLLLSKIKILI